MKKVKFSDFNFQLDGFYNGIYRFNSAKIDNLTNKICYVFDYSVGNFIKRNHKTFNLYGKHLREFLSRIISFTTFIGIPKYFSEDSNYDLYLELVFNFIGPELIQKITPVTQNISEYMMLDFEMYMEAVCSNKIKISKKWERYTDIPVNKLFLDLLLECCCKCKVESLNNKDVFGEIVDNLLDLLEEIFN